MKGPFRPPVANRLLATLSHEGLERTADDPDVVHLAFGEVLCEPGKRNTYVYFPEDCLISLLGVINGRMSLEIGLVGREGLVGISAALGQPNSQVRAVVQKAGNAIRIKSSSFLSACSQSPGLQHALFDHVYTLWAQTIQIAACSRFHSLEARLARLLLVTRDRLQSESLYLTHESIAYALGVRRVGVTKAASALQRRHLISYSRGEIQILDSAGLESVSCECYRIIKGLGHAH